MDRAPGTAVEGKVPAARITADQWNFFVGNGERLFAKLSAMRPGLAGVADRIFQGFKTGADGVFILNVAGKGRYESKCLNRRVQLESRYLRPLFKSGQFKRYRLRAAERVIIFPYRDGTLIGWGEIKAKAPRTADYLSACKQVLERRESRRWAGPSWYGFSRTQALEVMSSVKILTADLNPSANYCLDTARRCLLHRGRRGRIRNCSARKIAVLRPGSP